MTTKITTQNQAPAKQDIPRDTASLPTIIATRKRCEADGVGLSHYILMDRKVAK
jgi:modified peptide precursor CbpA